MLRKMNNILTFNEYLNESKEKRKESFNITITKKEDEDLPNLEGISKDDERYEKLLYLFSNTKDIKDNISGEYRHIFKKLDANGKELFEYALDIMNTMKSEDNEKLVFVNKEQPIQFFNFSSITEIKNDKNDISLEEKINKLFGTTQSRVGKGEVLLSCLFDDVYKTNVDDRGDCYLKVDDGKEIPIEVKSAGSEFRTYESDGKDKYILGMSNYFFNEMKRLKSKEIYFILFDNSGEDKNSVSGFLQIKLTGSVDKIYDTLKEQCDINSNFLSTKPKTTHFNIKLNNDHKIIFNVRE